MDLLERAWAFDREIQERSASRVHRFDLGAALYTPELPRVFDANFVRIDRGFDSLTPELAKRLADELQGELMHRKLLLPDERAGERLAAGLERPWTVTRTVVMRYAGPQRRNPGAASEAEIVDPRSLRAAREEALPESDPEVQRQIGMYPERLALANDGRVFAARDDGEPAAFCTLFEGGGTGEIDEVTTLERFRNRGLGTAVVEAALQTSLASGNDFTYLVAAEDDWPKQWYERLGFVVLGRRYEVWRAG